MRPGFNYLADKKVPARPSGNSATVIKYGKEIKMQEFINEAREGTELNERIKEQGLQTLKGAGVKSDTSDTVIDMSMNFVSACKIAKIARITEKELKIKLEKEKELKIKQEKEREQKNNGTGESESK